MVSETQIIEGELVEEQRALAVVPDQGMAATGALALAALDDDEFERRLSALTKGIARVERIQKALMTKDVDYGVIPGTPKPTLYKPGAEMLCQAYSLAGDFNPRRTIGDGVEAPHLSYLTRCDLHLGSLDGPVVAVGYGAANSWEKRYRYRKAERICPKCQKPAVIKGAEQYGGGWLCWKKRDGCGTKWPDGAAEIEAGDVDNPDPFDLDVVLAKMAEKRAHVDATLRATNASRLFTQDVEDLARPDPDPSRVDKTTGEVFPVGTTHESGLVGIAELGKAKGKDRDGNPKGPPPDTQYELRQEATRGYVIGFRLTQGRKGYKVLAFGDLAASLSMLNIIGERVTCWGTMHDESFVNDDGRTIAYQVMHLERIETPDGILPAPQRTPGAESVPLFPEDEDLSGLDF